jgi:xylose isomerase-like TIM barrel
LYEALHPKECNFGNHTQECYQTVQHIHSPNLKLVYDVYHAINAGEQYADSRMCFDEIRHVHINSWDQGLQRYFLFEKDLPYVKDLCVFLQSVGYDNTISVEAFDADFPETGAASVSIIREALYEAEIKHPLSRTPSL